MNEYSKLKARVPLGTQFHTGQTCKESGVYRFAGYMDYTPSYGVSTTIPLAVGNTFPPYNGKGAKWRLEVYA